MDTRLKLSPEQATAVDDRKLVLTGDVNSPATTVARGADGGDARAADEQEALDVLARRFDGVELIEAEFTDTRGGGPYRLQVWVPITG